MAQDLYAEISGLDTIDAHEHLLDERAYLDANYSGPNLFAGGYIWHDLESAGLDSAFKSTLQEDGFRPVESWWPKIKPFWEFVKFASFGRALLIAVRDLYEINEINDDTIHHLAERVVADNTPGLYQRILYDRCRLRKVITCRERVSFPDEPNFCGLSTLLGELIHIGTYERVHRDLLQRTSISVRSAEDLVLSLQKTMREDLALGAVGFKIAVDNFGEPNLDQAEREFKKYRSTSEPIEKFPALRDYVVDRCFDIAAEAHVPVAVHTGYWADFRRFDPKFMLDFAVRRSDIQFDLFHLGMPMIRDAILIGKTVSNISLNLTWSPIISQTQTVRTLDEILDLIPINKIIAFGGDYRVSVQKVWGHLVMVRECVAAALSKRVESGQLSYDDALRVAKMWFFDNPNRFYSLSLE